MDSVRWASLVLLTLAAGGPSPLGAAQVTGQVEDAPFRGGGFRLEIRCAQDVLLILPAERPVNPGERVGLILPPGAWVAYPQE